MPDQKALVEPAETMPSRRAGEPASRTYMWGVLLLYVSVATLPNLQLQKADPKKPRAAEKKEITRHKSDGRCCDGRCFGRAAALRA